MFYSWSPDALIATIPVTRVSFLDTSIDCMASHDDNNVWGANSSRVCDESDQILTKYGETTYWRHPIASDGFQMLSHAIFELEEVNQFLREMQNEDVMIVACNWVKNNSAKWKRWVPEEQFNELDEDSENVPKVLSLKIQNIQTM